jgi:4'-phosphopantetheinyl transferase EntD
VAAAARTQSHAAVGIDVERAGALPAPDAALVLAPQEHAAVADHPDPDALATSLWSAKEAAFKAWSTATDGGLGPVDPVDLHVQLEPDGALAVTPAGRLRRATAGVGPLTGRSACAEGYVITLVARRRRAPAAG